MNVHNKELHRQGSEAKAIRARLMDPGGWVKLAEAERLRVALNSETERTQKALAENEVLKSRLMRQGYQVSKLELDLADRDARILAQADRICLLENVGMTGRQDKKPVADIIAEVLADFPDVTWKEICGIRRSRRLIVPRQRCMFEVSRQRPDLSFPAIGRIFGGRDHTTIIHAVRKLKSQAPNDDATPAA